MPPPIQSNSGSRAALITWTVVTSILFVVATVLAIFAHVEANRLSTEKDSLTARYDAIVSEADVTGELVNAMKAIKANEAARFGDARLLAVAAMQRDTLAKQIAGPGAGGEADALKAADAALTPLTDGRGAVKVTANSLSGAVTALAGQVKSRQTEIQQLTVAREDLSKKLDAVNAAFTGQLTTKDDDIGKSRQQVQAALGDVETNRTDKDKQILDMQSKMDEQAKLAQDSINQLTAQKTEADQTISKKDNVIKGLQTKLRDIRQPVDQVLRQADAKILRTVGDGVVYLDLGTGDQVVPGMSFEVFDRIEGIPRPGDPTNDENLPKGKGSIEIIRVMPGSSEARIVRQTPGQTVVEGDVLVNVAYDRAIKYNITVYGNFDLDRNGQPTATDADVIKRLVTQWGGRVADTLTVDTDFLVIGKVPEIPNYSQEELDRPEVQFEVENKKKELTAYDDVLARAIELNIPVLNQNRFLYFSGYYEQSAR